METVTKKVLYKTELKNVKFSVQIGYASQGECVVRMPEKDFKDEIDVANVANRVYDDLSSQVLVIGKFSPAPGKSVIIVQLVFIENGKPIHKEVIERQTQTFERISNIFLLEKSKD